MVIIPSYLTIYLRCSDTLPPLLSRPLFHLWSLISLVSVNSWTGLVSRQLYRYRCTTLLSLLSPCFTNPFAHRLTFSAHLPHLYSHFSFLLSLYALFCFLSLIVSCEHFARTTYLSVLPFLLFRFLLDQSALQLVLRPDAPEASSSSFGPT